MEPLISHARDLEFHSQTWSCFIQMVQISFVNQSFNGTIDLTCKGSGIPLPNLELLHPNGTKLNTMKKKDSKEIKLHINIAEPAPVVKYTCVGTNIHGETRVEIMLELKDEPTSLTVGLIIGIVFLSLLVVVVTVLVALIYWRRRKTPGKVKAQRMKFRTSDGNETSPPP
uniref:Uncharacterized protein n=1 Tax=Eptatretus burgeri TaxID=7764 RepID=A0A8C4R2P7_EPTBU